MDQSDFDYINTANILAFYWQLLHVLLCPLLPYLALYSFPPPHGFLQELGVQRRCLRTCLGPKQIPPYQIAAEK